MKPQDTAWRDQPYWFISTIETSRFLARIFSEEQREAIKRLIDHGFFPIQTVSGKIKATRKHWNLIKYRGRRGIGFKMISAFNFKDSYGNYRPCSLNSVTYFIKPQAS